MYLSYLDFFFHQWRQTRSTVFVVVCCYPSPLLLFVFFLIVIYHQLLSAFCTAIFFFRKWWHHHCQFTITIVENSLYNNAFKQPLLKSFLILSYVHSPGNSYSSGYPKGKNQLPLLKRWLLFSELLLFLYETNSPMPWFVSHL